MEQKQYEKFDFGGKVLVTTEEQRRIITEDLASHMKIIACAGSGKTTTIICRVKYLLDHGVAPNQIIITTFNVEASYHIKEKISQLLGAHVVDEILVGNIDKISFMFFIRFFPKKQVMGVKEFSREFLRYLRSKEGQARILSFYRYFFFDEFQDINQIQYDILMEFYRFKRCAVTVIGDDAQNIYSWRGSSLEFIRSKIDEDVPTLKTFRLSTNYRSTPEIIQISNRVIAQSKLVI